MLERKSASLLGEVERLDAYHTPKKNFFTVFVQQLALHKTVSPQYALAHTKNLEKLLAEKTVIET